MSDISCDIKDTIVSIPSDTDGWNVEINLISWNNRDPKYDIRKWNEDHSKSGKGLTLSEDEIVILFQNYREILEKITGETIE